MKEAEYNILWCMRLYTYLALGGEWMVPRSGLIFTKTKLEPPTLELTAVMPHVEDMPYGPADLRHYQAEEFQLIREKFSDAGIVVLDTQELL